MDTSIICCDPHGRHIRKPCIASRKSKANFRPITETMRVNSAILLPLQGHICNSCRLALGRVGESSEPKVPTTRMQSNEGSSFTRNIKSIVCSNPCELHVTPRKKGFGETWFRISGKLHQKVTEIELPRPVLYNEYICFECKHRICMMHTKLHFPGVYCADPARRHQKPNKKNFLTAFREVTQENVDMASVLGLGLSLGDHLCWGCQNKLKKDYVDSGKNVMDDEVGMDVDEITLPETLDNFRGEDATDFSQTSASGESSGLDSDDDYLDDLIAEEKFRSLCTCLGIEFHSKSELRNKSKIIELKENLTAQVRFLLKSFLKQEIDFDAENLKGCMECQQLVAALIERHKLAETVSERYQCMTCTPGWVSAAKIKTNFGVSKGTALKASKLRKRFGPLSHPPPKMGKRIDSRTVKLVELFYRDDQNSRFSPSARDTIYVRTNVAHKSSSCVKTLVQKRELMCTMRQLYIEFKERYPNIAISVSKFASLKPKECVWGVQKGFPKYCLCLIHTNFKLICEALNLKGKTGEILDIFFCSDNEICMMGACAKCPNFEYIDELLKVWEAPCIDYWNWETITRGRSIELRKKTLSLEEYSVQFKSNVSKVAEHHFIFAKQQDYIQKIKKCEGLGSNIAVVNVDFGQNYTFVVPNAVQSFHWSNSQATVHPFCMYYKTPDDDSVRLFSFIVISDCLTHDATSFHVFRSVFIRHLKLKFSWIDEIIYVSDGAGSQYKNVKNFTNLYCHFLDCAMKAKWVFSGSGHGKDLVDAMSAVAKRLTRSESLRRKDNFILSAEDMCSFLNNQNKDANKTYSYISESFLNEYVREKLIEERYASYKPVPGTRKFHFIEVQRDIGLICKPYATSDESYLHNFSTNSFVTPELIPPCESIQFGQYACFVRSGILFVGMVTNINKDVGEISLQIMKPAGNSFVWANPVVLKKFSELDFVTKLSAPNPLTSSCRHYQFISRQIQNAQVKANEITALRKSFLNN